MINFNEINLSLFPILINKFNNFLNYEECNQIIKYSKKFKFKNHGALIGKAVSNHNFKDNIFIDLNKKFNFLNKLHVKINEYSNKLGLEDVTIVNSWINFQYKKSKLLKHTHPNNIISGVLFLKTDKNSSKLYFYNPNPFISFMNIKNNNLYNNEFIWIKPEIGNLILFPSWLSHGSHIEENRSKERISLSFNAK